MNLTLYFCKKTMPTLYDVRAKYPRWAHRRDEHKRRRRKKRSRRKKKSDQAKTQALRLLLSQMLLGGPVAKKHGENVRTGYTGAVKPDLLSTWRSQVERNKILDQRAGAGSAL